MSSTPFQPLYTNLVKMDPSLLITVFCVVTLIFGMILGYVSYTSPTKLPRVSPRDFNMTMSSDFRGPKSLQWTQLFTRAAEKLRKPFIVAVPGGSDTVVLPPDYIDYIKNNQDLSFNESLLKSFPSYVSGFKPISMGLSGYVLHDAVRTKLTQALVHFTDDMNDEAKQALPELLPQKEEWQETQLRSSMPALISRLSSVIFMGRDFQHVRQWQKISTSFTVNLFNASRVLRGYQPWLRPIVHWFLPECQLIRRQRKEAAAIIEPEISARRLRRQQAEREGKVIKRSLDSVDWFEDCRKGREFNIVDGELLIAVVSIETSTHTLTNAILDIASQPELMRDIRKEIIAIVQEDGGIQKTTLHKAKLLDSAMKESQRLRPVSQALLERVAQKDVILPDGTFIPKNGSVIAAPLPHYNSKVYPDPYTYDGYRFLNLRHSAPENENKWQFASTQPEHIGFGHGIHACPGRFFASNAIKIALMHLIMHYDWKIPSAAGEKSSELPERPLDLEHNFEILADPDAKLLFRARTPEIGF